MNIQFGAKAYMVQQYMMPEQQQEAARIRRELGAEVSRQTVSSLTGPAEILIMDDKGSKPANKALRNLSRDSETTLPRLMAEWKRLGKETTDPIAPKLCMQFSFPPMSLHLKQATNTKITFSATPSPEKGNEVPVRPDFRPADHAVGSVPKASAGVRFGNAQNDAEAKRILESILPRISEAGNWDSGTVYDLDGLQSGESLAFVLDDAVFSLKRDTRYDAPDPQKDFTLTVLDPGKEPSLQTLPLAKETYTSFRDAFHQVGEPKIAQRHVNDALENVDNFVLRNYTQGHPYTSLSFIADGKRYSIIRNRDGTCELQEEQTTHEDDIRQAWQQYVQRHEEANAYRPFGQRQASEPYEDFHKRFTHTPRMNKYRISEAQYTALCNALEREIQARMTATYGFGPGRNPTPLLHRIARELLANPREGNIGYHRNNDAEKTEKVDYNDARRIQLRKVNRLEGGIDYLLLSSPISSSMPGLWLQVKQPEDIALIEKMLEIAKTLDTKRETNALTSQALQALEKMDEETRNHTLKQLFSKDTPQTWPDLLAKLARLSNPNPVEKPAENLKRAARLLDELEALLPPEKY